MMIFQRTVAPALNALFVTLGLLMLMYQLVKVESPQLAQGTVRKIPPFNVVTEDEPPNLIVPPDRLIDVEEAPDRPLPSAVIDIDPISVDVLGPTYIPPKSKGLALPDNTQLVLTLGFPPNYPGGAIRNGTEGYAVVGFSVAASGAVFDAFIIESEPRSVFDRASLKAISRFKYNPKMVAGKSVATTGQRYKFTYRLDKN